MKSNTIVALPLTNSSSINCINSSSINCSIKYCMEYAEIFLDCLISLYGVHVLS